MVKEGRQRKHVNKTASSVVQDAKLGPAVNGGDDSGPGEVPRGEGEVELAVAGVAVDRVGQDGSLRGNKLRVGEGGVWLAGVEKGGEIMNSKPHLLDPSSDSDNVKEERHQLGAHARRYSTLGGVGA